VNPTAPVPASSAAGRVQRLTPADAARYRALMLVAYAAHPEAFTSTPAERAALPLAWWETRLSDRSDADSVVLGAWVEAAEQGQMEELAGVVGLSFNTGHKTSHKAQLFGMVVAAEFRGQGWGDALLRAALAEAASRPGLRLVQLTVTEGNQAAQALYSRHGFAPFGMEPEAMEVNGQLMAKQHLWCRL
jgi:ribosomal protein S18 acetylase RimI-like enzyme